jgi:hypothetical protein
MQGLWSALLVSHRGRQGWGLTEEHSGLVEMRLAWKKGLQYLLKVLKLILQAAAASHKKVFKWELV